MITRYTTPYHYFILPIPHNLIKAVYITYSQNGDLLFEKNTLDGSISIMEPDQVDNTVFGTETNEYNLSNTVLLLHLSQEETSQFTFYPAAEKNIALIQLRVISTDGDAYVSRVIRDRIWGTLKQEVVDGEEN